jgi:uncharacterized protein
MMWPYCPPTMADMCLIACKKTPAAPFQDVAWGSEHVLQQTRERCRTAALRLWEGEVLWDVDRPEDLLRLGQPWPVAAKS